MNIFDDIISKVESLVAGEKCETFSYSENKIAISTNKNELILSGESAFELGAMGKSCVNFVAVSSSEHFIKDDEIVVIGNGLKDIKGDCNFARITLIRTDDITSKGEQTAYNIFKEIELSKFNVFADGYMIRSSGFYGREQVRVGKKMLKKGLSFEKIGNAFINQYKKNRHVMAVKIIFITLDSFCYETLETLGIESTRRIKALNHMLSDLNMDCKSCEWKPVCDEVEGMKEMHQNMIK